MKEILRKGKKTKSKVHLVRPVRTKEYEKYFSEKKELFMPKSTFERLAEKVKAILFRKKVKVIYERLPGRPIAQDHEKMKKALALYKSGFSYREIEKKTGLPKSSVHYLIKKAKRNKIKNGSEIYSLD